MYMINPQENRISPITVKTFSALGFKEREHLQEWLANQPFALGEELLTTRKQAYRSHAPAWERIPSRWSGENGIRFYRSRAPTWECLPSRWNGENRNTRRVTHGPQPISHHGTGQTAFPYLHGGGVAAGLYPPGRGADPAR